VKRYLIILALLIPSLACADSVIVAKKKAAACADSSCTGFLVCQNFEGSGYDNSETWVDADDTPDPDYTTVKLRGDQSFFCDGSGGYCAKKTPTFSASGELYYFFRFRTSALVNWTTYFWGKNSGGTDKLKVEIWADGTFNVIHGSANANSSSGAIAINTTYYVWLYYKKSASGAGDGLYKAYVGTSTSFASATQIVNGSNGNSEDDLNQVQIGKSNTATTAIFDQLLIKTSAIGDVCN
jgi:hypothetical protein